jgi:arylsulfatase A-like enzyme
MAVIFVVIVVAAVVFGVFQFQGRPGGWPEQLTSGSARGFNVLLITLDTTRADRLGCYGRAEAETPVLDQLAAGGIRFDDAVTVAPITLPSHTTILTGLIPPNHGVRHNGEFHLAPDHVTLPEVLRDQGYETAAFLSAFVLDARFGLDQGFDVYDDNVAVSSATTAGAFIKPIYERSAARVTDSAIQWLSKPSRKGPFFCWVHYFDPHSP